VRRVGHKPRRPRDDDCRDDRPDRPDDRVRIEEEPQGVWLVIRYDAADAGSRPIPEGDVFWASPDIWISGGDALGNAIAGQPTGVHARVWNLGNFPATPTRVDFSFVDPTLGITWDAPALIGSEWISVPALSAVEVECPDKWVPAETGSTHACLLVTCSTSPLDPATAPNNPKADRHTGQRNVTIVQPEAGQPLQFEFLLAPVLGHVTTLQVAASATELDRRGTLEWPGPGSLVRILERLARIVPEGEPETLTMRALVLAREQAEQNGLALEPRQVGELLGMKEVAHPEGHPELVDLGARFQTRERRPQRLELGFEAPQLRTDLVLHLWQLEGGEVTGGYSILVKA
jgi:hypothetical protein